MDFLSELESMATTADVDLTEDMNEAVLRWQNVFHYSAEEAKAQIMRPYNAAVQA